MTDQIKVLYLTGAGRSGGTILGNIVGELPGVFSAGELHRVWDAATLDTRRCGCGLRLVECGVWRGIFDEAFGGIDRGQWEEMRRLRDQSTRTRRVAAVLFPPLRARLLPRLQPYVAATGRLYQAIAKTTGCAAIVDSSRLPAYGYILGGIPAIDLRVVQLVRDPRGVAFSWQKKQAALDDRTVVKLGNQGCLRSALDWDVQNIVSEWWGGRLGSRRRLFQYERVVADPQRAVDGISEFLGVDAKPLLFDEEGQVRLGAHHTLTGNYNRFRTGLVAVKLDDAWQARMKARDRLAVALLTWPLMVRYGYGGGGGAQERG